ncbi:alpha/beta fold hydrolase [Sphingomonas sp. MMS12-HWE2-04]|uniref:alpha/beta fold hydrolase n=1 Tax=Sphingomonas sp. MMS12-HWE2-04 TaxID=3234199 RepID=UPI00385065AA
MQAAAFGLGVAALLAAIPAAAQNGRFDIGGRTIRLACRGEGAPTVVIDAGMGTAPAEDQAWQGIAARIAPTTRACLYDRAGLGGSDPVAKGAIRTSADMAADLEAALRKAGVKPPFLLVGHSIGGLHAQVFAARYPKQVAGLVLVSSTHPKQFTTWRAILPGPAAGEPELVAKARAILARMDSDVSMNSESLDVLASNRQALALQSLGDKPVIVATHSPTYRMVPDLPEAISVQLEAGTQRLQKQFLSLSPNAVQHIAAKAGHGLPHEDPDFVVANILEGVAAVRKRR